MNKILPTNLSQGIFMLAVTQTVSVIAWGLHAATQHSVGEGMLTGILMMLCVFQYHLAGMIAREENAMTNFRKDLDKVAHFLGRDLTKLAMEGKLDVEPQPTTEH